MITLDNKAMPRAITPTNIKDLEGEHAYWFCYGCRTWNTTRIEPGGSIVCPSCGSGPDWTKKLKPVLAYSDRHKRVDLLLSEDSSLSQELADLEQRYAAFIDEAYKGMSAKSKAAGEKYFHRAWMELEEIADYLLTAADAPKTDTPKAYTQKGLDRKARTHTEPKKEKPTEDGEQQEEKKPPIIKSVQPVSSVNINREEYGPHITDMEAVEIMSYQYGSTEPFEDTYFNYDYLEPITDPVERSIAQNLAEGLIHKKRDIERHYNLSEAQVKTKFKHIRKALHDAGYRADKAG